jgi:nucleotide-binding universal stress UspA family protein
MTLHIIVGFNGTDGGRDALALALATVDADPDTAHAVTVVCAYTVDSYGHAAPGLDVEYRRALAADAEERLTDARTRCAGRSDVTFEVRGGTSPAGALHLLATELDARAIIVGRSHTTTVTRPFVGSVTEQTLHGAPCAVLVAPAGYAARATEVAPTLGTVAVAYDGGPESRHALEVAADLARTRGARLVLTQVLEPLATPYGGLAPYPFPERRSDAQAALERVAAGLDGVDATAQAVEGLAVDVLADAATRADLLVVGSRGFGPVRRVLLGSVSSRLARRCDAPLLVVPRATEEDAAGAAAEDAGAARTA